MSVPVLVSRCFEVARVYTARVLDTYTKLEGEADLAGDVREGVAGDLAREVGECLTGEVGEVFIPIPTKLLHKFI